MSDPEERSPGGSEIYRHHERAGDVELAVGDPERIAAIEAHVTGHVGPVSNVFHEILSDLVHIDVHMIPPQPHRPGWTLFTTGMSDRPMKSPSAETAYAELLITLPPDWLLTDDAFEDERWYWPVRLLKMLARLPHVFDTWLHMDHTVPNGDPAEEYAPGLGFDGCILFPSVTLGQPFMLCEHGDERIAMLAVYPLYPEEMQLKLDHGADALLDRLEQRGITDFVEPGRPNVAKRRKLFGLF